MLQADPTTRFTLPHGHTLQVWVVVLDDVIRGGLHEGRLRTPAGGRQLEGAKAHE